MIFGTRQRPHTKIQKIKRQIGVQNALKMNVQAQIIATALFGMPNASITRTIYVLGPSGSGS